MTQKTARVESVIELKKVLCSAKHYGWRYILTGDESWFYFIINPDSEPPAQSMLKYLSRFTSALTVGMK
jgi:hypothetical protein